ncbi:MAG: isoprenyl transferase [Deltaproteobacteria bacterium]|nr:isoprenyl transferase [Deltaproteobacteria bacterium]
MSILPAGTNKPRHIAIIMDGNGRWAVEKGLNRLEGHIRGAQVVREISTFARELNIPYLTLYSFSVQNWNRPAAEVTGLMQLLHDYCMQEGETLMRHNIRLNTIGGLDRLPEATRIAISNLIDQTAGNRAMTLTLALDYGGREEIIAAMRRLAVDVKTKRLSPEAIDESAINSRLDTALLPDPDLVIRTSGEQRVSNFLLWQIAYAEFHFTKTRWPDFTKDDLLKAIDDYSHRERRFGGLESTSATAATLHDSDDAFVLGDLPLTDDDDLDKGPRPC